MGRGKRHASGRERSGQTFIPLGDGSGRHRPVPQGELKKLPQEWAREHGIFILDADGWRPGDLSFDEPCTLAEYERRAPICTQMPLADFERGR